MFYYLGQVPTANVDTNVFDRKKKSEYSPKFTLGSQ